ncbi:hypothetical protein [Phenylobacterium sp.]|uniref:hypothetical protein n=1 Tax=Phenylobacterium sp. TaxID=1871053 RepID=UPI002736A469|nr:hypothetical protein [Phenylobacterium sp.]MDP3593359.1 hypothetical protein [Phenylobacterium sp.]
MRALTLAGVVLLIAAPAQAETAQQVFFARLSALCGQTFDGRVVTTDPADASFTGKPLTMRVKSCTKEEVRIPFQVGEDRSRTWVVTRTATGLRLKHDHRHPDGTEDAVSQYGGDATTAGTAARQEFPVDAASKAMFVREDRTISLTNVWAMEVEPGKLFAYELRRPDRHFRVEFDLAKPLP